MVLSSAALAAKASSRSPGPPTGAGDAGGAGSRATSNWHAAPLPARRSAARRTISSSRADTTRVRAPHPSWPRRASTYAGVAIAGRGGVSSSAPRRRTGARQGKARCRSVSRTASAWSGSGSRRCSPSGRSSIARSGVTTARCPETAPAAAIRAASPSPLRKRRQLPPAAGARWAGQPFAGEITRAAFTASGPARGAGQATQEAAALEAMGADSKDRFDRRRNR